MYASIKAALKSFVSVFNKAANKPLMGHHRDALEEQKVRMMLLTGALSYQMYAMMTKTKTDDKRAMAIIQTLNDPIDWAKIADIIWGPEDTA